MMKECAIEPPLSFVVAASILALGLSACSSERETRTTNPVTVSDVYITEPVMGERAAMYCRVANASADDDSLLSVSTPVADSTELHKTVERSGMVRMEPVSALVAPAGGELRLSPGGYHVMLLDLRQQFAVGDSVELTLHFRDAGDIVVQAEVLRYVDVERLLEPDAQRESRNH
jgi:copper(I)-binding protein